MRFINKIHWTWYSLISDYLLLKSIEVVVVDMRVAKRVHELAGRQPRHVGDHVREEGVAAVKIYVV